MLACYFIWLFYFCSVNIDQYKLTRLTPKSHKNWMQFVASDDNFADPIIFRRKIIHTSLIPNVWRRMTSWNPGWIEKYFLTFLSVASLMTFVFLCTDPLNMCALKDVNLYIPRNKLIIHDCTDSTHCGKLLVQKH